MRERGLSEVVYVIKGLSTKGLYSCVVWDEALICAMTHSYVTERWGAGVETQKNVRGEVAGWGRVPFNETYAPSLSTIYDGA